jgi:hypothetical protein
VADPVSIRRGGRTELLDMFDEVTELYLAIRSEPQYPAAPSLIYTRESFVSRTATQADRDGSTITAARQASDELVRVRT